MAYILRKSLRLKGNLARNVKLCQSRKKAQVTNPLTISNANRYQFNDGIDDLEREKLLLDFTLREDFISEDEEKSLLNEIQPYLKRTRYQYDHWDNAIHGFKETELLKWNDQNNAVIDRVRRFAFPPGESFLPHVHVLDLAGDGIIKPHIDSVRFCGDVIAGLSLLSDSVMRFTRDKDGASFDVLLKTRSLYVMKGVVRYDFAHAILPSGYEFKGMKIEKFRRISIINRSEPRERDDA